MSKKKSQPQTKSEFIDAVEQWEAETRGGTSLQLEEIRLDENERLIIPFTVQLDEVAIHYSNYESIRGYVRCNGSKCSFCLIGNKVRRVQLLPVYDPVEQRVGVLSIGPDLRPAALKPQLLPILRRVKNSEELLVTIVKTPGARYLVEARALPDRVDKGLSHIQVFHDSLARGEVDLKSIYKQVDDAELVEYPEIARNLEFRGQA